MIIFTSFILSQSRSFMANLQTLRPCTKNCPPDPAPVQRYNSTSVQQGGIPSCILFNILFDFIMRSVIVTAKQMGVTGIQLAYGSNDFHHTDHDKYEEFDLLALMYADDLVTMCDNMADLEIFIRTFEQVTQQFGLTMSIKKTRVMSLKPLREDATRRLIKDQEVPANNFPIIIRNQTIEIVEEFSYLGFRVNREQTMEEEIETRLSKASTAFNMLRHAIWYRKMPSNDHWCKPRRPNVQRHTSSTDRTTAT
ncbi:unnamed protein product [Adineta ricciae]|uniref:Reverse transcriptase domain-containing protein n=1 Tax=Adineta ricciae TaxID=249248 RepID=A0A815DBE6_ADIRI|nr:unnamed protein product [Adineta ricciae]